MHPLLRPAAAEDAPQVAELLISTRRRFMQYAPSAHPEHDVRSWVASRLIPSGGVVVAETQGQVVGVIATEVEGTIFWITQLAVVPDLVNNGVGSHLLAHAIRTLGRPIRLYSFQQNTGARRFYERNGFVAIKFTDGQANEERCPDVLYELARRTEA